MKEKLVYEVSIYSVAELSIQAEPILNTLKLERKDRRHGEREVRNRKLLQGNPSF